VLGSEQSCICVLGSEQSCICVLGSEQSCICVLGSDKSCICVLGSEQSCICVLGSEQSCICVLGSINLASISTIFQLDFGTVPTVVNRYETSLAQLAMDMFHVSTFRSFPHS
jgi:hypothetical protein